VAVGAVQAERRGVVEAVEVTGYRVRALQVLAAETDRGVVVTSATAATPVGGTGPGVRALLAIRAQVGVGRAGGDRDHARHQGEEGEEEGEEPAEGARGYPASGST
jgi:hypothetical protein